MIAVVVLATVLCCLMVAIIIGAVCAADTDGDFECNVGFLLVTVVVCFLAGLALREACGRVADADQASKDSAVIQSLPRSAEKP